MSEFRHDLWVGLFFVKESWRALKVFSDNNSALRERIRLEKEFRAEQWLR